VAGDPQRESRRAAAFARTQAAFPLSITITDLKLPDGARLDDDEFVVRTAKDWGLSIKSLVLTTRRLFCPSDLTDRTTASLPLADVTGVTLSKHLIGFSTIVVNSRDRPQASFPVHINGQLVRSDIAAAVAYANGSVGSEQQRTVSASPGGDRYDQLRKINELRQSGVLTEAEFEEEKARVLKQP
jgi:hypothetical protein